MNLRLNLLTRPLQRMVAGGFLFALAFVISGMLEVKLEVSEEILF